MVRGKTMFVVTRYGIERIKYRKSEATRQTLSHAIFRTYINCYESPHFSLLSYEGNLEISLIV